MVHCCNRRGAGDRRAVFGFTGARDAAFDAVGRRPKRPGANSSRQQSAGGSALNRPGRQRCGETGSPAGHPTAPSGARNTATPSPAGFRAAGSQPDGCSSPFGGCFREPDERRRRSGQGRAGFQEMPGLSLGGGRQEHRRPKPCRCLRTQSRRSSKLQLFPRDEGLEHRLGCRRSRLLYSRSEGFSAGQQNGLPRPEERAGANECDCLSRLAFRSSAAGRRSCAAVASSGTARPAAASPSAAAASSGPTRPAT